MQCKINLFCQFADNKTISNLMSYLTFVSFTDYKTLFESSANGQMVIYDDCIIQCNKKAVEILQIPYQSLHQHNFAHALSLSQAYGDFAQQNLAEKLALALQGQSQTFDWFYLSAEQHTINIQISINKIAIENKDYAEVRLIDTTHLAQLQQAINFIATEVASDADNSFFEKLILRLSSLFNARHAFIGLYDSDENNSITTFVLCANGKIVTNKIFPIINTPCFEVTNNVPVAYPDNVQQLFPGTQCLAEMNAESYVSIPLISTHNIPIGLLALLDDKAMNDTKHIQDVMQIYALRIANEIERLNINKELLKAKNNAEQAYQAKAEFLSNMSHELRTPLHAILSYSDFGRKKKNLSADKLFKYFNSINISGARLLHLVNNLLDLSKMEAGKIILSLTTEKLSYIIKNCIDELGFAIDEKNIGLVLIPGISNDALQCDKTLIHQLIINILSNAIKFSPSDSSIEVCFHEDESAVKPTFIYITIKDCGPGIPADELDTVFNEFIQSSMTKTGAGGTGLGLAISRNIVAVHHGKIWASNAENKTGSVFHIQLPYNQKQLN